MSRDNLVTNPLLSVATPVRPLFTPSIRHLIVSTKDVFGEFLSPVHRMTPSFSHNCRDHFWALPIFADLLLATPGCATQRVDDLFFFTRIFSQSMSPSPSTPNLPAAVSSVPSRSLPSPRSWFSQSAPHQHFHILEHGLFLKSSHSPCTSGSFLPSTHSFLPAHLDTAVSYTTPVLRCPNKCFHLVELVGSALISYALLSLHCDVLLQETTASNAAKAGILGSFKTHPVACHIFSAAISIRNGSLRFSTSISSANFFLCDTTSKPPHGLLTFTLFIFQDQLCLLEPRIHAFLHCLFQPSLALSAPCVPSSRRK